MNVKMSFSAELEEAGEIKSRVQRLIALNQRAVAAAIKAGDKAVVAKLVQRGKKLTDSNLVRALVSIALQQKVSDAEMLDKIDQEGIKTGRPARAS